jgi:hypothetical protein
MPAFVYTDLFLILKQEKENVFILRYTYIPLTFTPYVCTNVRKYSQQQIRLNTLHFVSLFFGGH